MDMEEKCKTVKINPFGITDEEMEKVMKLEQHFFELDTEMSGPQWIVFGMHTAYSAARLMLKHGGKLSDVLRILRSSFMATIFVLNKEFRGHE